VKILASAKKGYDQLRRTHEKQILEMIDLRAVRLDNLSRRPGADRRKAIRCSKGGQFDVCNAVLTHGFRFGGSADSDRAAIDPRLKLAPRTNCCPNV